MKKLLNSKNIIILLLIVIIGLGLFLILADNDEPKFDNSGYTALQKKYDSLLLENQSALESARIERMQWETKVDSMKKADSKIIERLSKRNEQLSKMLVDISHSSDRELDSILTNSRYYALPEDRIK